VKTTATACLNCGKQTAGMKTCGPECLQALFATWRARWRDFKPTKRTSGVTPAAVEVFERLEKTIATPAPTKIAPEIEPSDETDARICQRCGNTFDARSLCSPGCTLGRKRQQARAAAEQARAAHEKWMQNPARND
jgi:hypothetical protein